MIVFRIESKAKRMMEQLKFRDVALKEGGVCGFTAVRMPKYTTAHVALSSLCNVGEYATADHPTFRSKQILDLRWLQFQ